MSDVVFFVDRSLGKEFPDFLRASGLTVKCHHEEFMPTVPDSEQIAKASRQRWYWVSKGTRIYKNPVQLYSVLSNGLGYFVLSSGGTLADLAANFVSLTPKILSLIDRVSRPFVATVSGPGLLRRSGRVSVRKTQRDIPPMI